MLAHHLGLWLQGRCQNTVFHTGMYTPDPNSCVYFQVQEQHTSNTQHNWDSVFREKGLDMWTKMAHILNISWLEGYQDIFAIDYLKEQLSAGKIPQTCYCSWHGTNSWTHVRASNLSHCEMHHYRKLQKFHNLPRPNSTHDWCCPVAYFLKRTRVFDLVLPVCRRKASKAL